jgi:hypothetical protein
VTMTVRVGSGRALWTDSTEHRLWIQALIPLSLNRNSPGCRVRGATCMDASTSRLITQTRLESPYPLFSWEALHMFPGRATRPRAPQMLRFIPERFRCLVLNQRYHVSKVTAITPQLRELWAIFRRPTRGVCNLRERTADCGSTATRGRSRSAVPVADVSR